jgi:hypothetical protein
MDGPAGVKKVAGTGTEQTWFHSGKQGVESVCDAECDAISKDRLEFLARAVVLVAGMKIPEAAQEAVLARVVEQGSRRVALLEFRGASMGVRLPEPTLMADYLFTNYFLNEVLRKRPYIKPE